MTTKLNPTQRKSLGLPEKWMPRPRAKNEALPNQVNKLAGVYKPQEHFVRSGANDHFQYKSRGV